MEARIKPPVLPEVITMGRWQNQEEALRFAMSHPACMLDMDMGTGKTRVAIDAAFAHRDVCRVLVVCPKAVIPVWRENLQKFAPDNRAWSCWDLNKGTVKTKSESLTEWFHNQQGFSKQFVVMNYDCVWRAPMGDQVLKAFFDMVILDESHRAKAAGSKVSKYLAILGKRVKYRMCLSGTPMANSPLDVYGQYRFLDPSIFGTNHSRFLQEYAIMGGPDMQYVVGYKNQKILSAKFRSIAYSCKMADVADRIKLPATLPPVTRMVDLPAQDIKMSKELSKDFIAGCSAGTVVVANVLAKMIRLQQITSGYCPVQEGPGEEAKACELNRVKEDSLLDILTDISPNSSVVVFCKFRHDIKSIFSAAIRAGRKVYELSGSQNSLDDWKHDPGSVIAVQIGAGAEGVDMTMANVAVYFSLPYSMAQYNQSMARLYRPGQTKPVTFIHLLARGTIDESIYKSLLNKKDIVESIKDGTFDLGYIK